jgi:hypothetical protein
MAQFLRKNRYKLALVILAAAVISAGSVWWFKRNGLDNTPLSSLPVKVESSSKIKNTYDVIVVGTDPEGIAAAVSAARNGLSVLLVDGREREVLGGLMTLGWLNSLDNNYSPEQPTTGKHNFLNKGIFQEWYDQIEGTSFDVQTAAKAFQKLVMAEKGIDLLLKVKEMKPLSETVGDRKAVTGLQITNGEGKLQTIRAKAVIDATQDADIAALTDVPFTVGREDIGDPKSQMAVTLVFKLKNVTPEVWASFGKHPNTGIDQTSGWGFTEMWNYPSSNKERVRMRGLNIGRQNDDTILINALQIFGVNPFDPKSVQEAYDIGNKEIPLVVDYLKTHFKEFAGVELAGVAPELYVRETRHMQGEYRLSMVDVLDNRDQWDRIAFGSYNVDIQSTSYQERGSIMMKPIQYAVPFRSLVPRQVDGLLVVGRSASFDTLPHGSARVITVGMATGQAAGAAAKLAIDKGISFQQLSGSKGDIAQLQEVLMKQGMELSPMQIKRPAYTEHKAYSGLKAAVSMNVAAGADQNEFKLDEPSNVQRFVNNMKGVRAVHAAAFKGDASAALKGVADPAKLPLTLQQAALIISLTVGLPDGQARSPQELVGRGWLKQETIAGIQQPNQLTNGDAYLLIRDVVQALTGKTYE